MVIWLYGFIHKDFIIKISTTIFSLKFLYQLLATSLQFTLSCSLWTSDHIEGKSNQIFTLIKTIRNRTFDERFSLLSI